jgi:hypothetical protein
VGSGAAHRPERLRLGGAEAQADDLPPTLGVHRHRDYGGHGDDPAALAHLQVGRVQPQVGPLALQRPVEEGVHALVDVLAQLRDRALADPGQAHRLDQLVHAPGGDAADPRLLDDGDERLLAHLPGLEEGREVAALAELGDAELQGPQPGVERALAVAVAPVQALRGALVPARADQALHVGLHQELQHGLGDGAQEIGIPGLLQQLGEWQSVVGHRSSVRVGASQPHPSRPGRWPPHKRSEFPPRPRTLP